MSSAYNTSRSKSLSQSEDPLQRLVADRDALQRLRMALGTFPSKAIGTIEDDELLVHTLREADRLARTYKQALDSLDEVNGHSAAVWKDYYLDHKRRFDNLVQQNAEVVLRSSALPPNQGTSSRVTHAQRQTQHDSNASASTSQMRDESRGRSSRRSVPVPAIPRSRHQVGPIKSVPSSTSRQTSSPISNSAPQKRPQSVSFSNWDTPPTPSRSPSPPAEVVEFCDGKNRFTAEDDRFALTYLKWVLSRDPTVTRNQISQMLAEKAPHHSTGSWSSRLWYIPQAKKIYAQAGRIYARTLTSARGTGAEAEIGPDDDDDDDGKPDDMSDVSNNNGDDDNDEENDDGGDEEDEVEYEDGNSATPLQRRPQHDEPPSRNFLSGTVSTARKGTRVRVTDEDKRNMARYIASRNDRHQVTQCSLWDDFATMFPSRSASAWNNNYYKYRQEIDEAVTVYSATTDAAKCLERAVNNESRKRQGSAGDPDAVQQGQAKKMKASPQQQ